jgi:succinyl-CoA synthetase alpha subunit
VAIIIDENTRVLIQGITGRFGDMVTRNMLDSGTKVVAGVTPGRAGESVWGVPVFDTVAEAVNKHGPIDASLLIVPGPGAKGAALEAIGLGIKTILMEVERVPLHDALDVISEARKAGVRLIGPGSGGAVSAGKAYLGFIGSDPEIARTAFVPGRIGVISRSGGQTSTLAWVICRAGLGISSAINLGSEPILGTTFAELLPLFQKDNETDGVAYFGEMGTVMEEEAAELIRESGYTKPLVAYIAGRGLPSGLRFSHASAIIEGGKGTPESKIKALRDAGAHVVEKPEDIGTVLQQIFGKKGDS